MTNVGWAEIRDERSHSVFLIMYAVERLLKTFWTSMRLDGEIIAAHSLWRIVTVYDPFGSLRLGACYELDRTSLCQADDVDFVKLWRRH